MKEIKNYRVISANELKLLVDDVKLSIGKGWQPIGGICVMEEGFPCYYQAMVIYHENPELLK